MSRDRTVDRGGCADLVLVMNVYFASGCGLHEAIRRAAEYSVTPASEELLRCLGPREASRPLEEALSHWAGTVGDLAAHIESTLRLGDSYGVSVGTILHQLAEDSRLEIRAVRRQRAGRLPISSLLPVVCCFLPGFLLLTLVPVLIGVVQGLTQ